MLLFSKCRRRLSWLIVLSLVFLTLLSLTPGLYAQSEFVRKGTSAVGLFGSYQGSTGLNGYALALGFTSDGMSDCGLSYGKVSGNSGWDATVYRVYADVFLVKSDPRRRPVSLAAGGSFQIQRYRIGSRGPSRDVNILSLFGTVCVDIIASPTVFLQPSFGPVWVKVLERGTDDKIGANAGLSLCCRGSRVVTFVMSFSLGHIEETQYALGVGILFEHPSKERYRRSR
jgi:hypothetical protein